MPGTLNPTSGTPQGSIKLGYDNIQGNTSGVVQEILFRTYEKMSEAAEKDILIGQVMSEPEEISKDQVLQSFNSSIIKETIDQDEDNLIRYIKVRVRIPEEHMALDVTTNFLNSFQETPGFNHNRGFGKASASSGLTKVLYPWFLFSYSSSDSGGASNSMKLKLGDIVQVRFANPRKRWGFLLGVVESNDIKNEANEEAQKTPAQAVEDLNSPISTIFKADKGPVAKPADDPLDISKMAEGPVVTVPDGNQIKTVVFDNKLIDARIAPHLGAMFRDSAAQGVSFPYVTSLFRVPFSKDNMSLDQLKSLIQGKQDWDGKPYKNPTSVGASQEALRYVNCGPTKDKDDGDLRVPSKSCRIVTGLPTSVSRSKSGHLFGNGADLPLGFKSSNYPTSSPEQMTKYYRWLSLNAWKYGFIRTVKSERWHWEYRPGLNMFSIVPRNNPLWDGQFDKDTIYEE